MDNEREWQRIELELRRQPRVNRAEIAAIMTRIHQPAPRSPVARAWSWLAEPRLTLSPIGAFAVVVVSIAVTIGIARYLSGAGARAVVASSEPPPVTRVIAPSAVANRQDVQFVLVAKEAEDVRIVGDFNDWDPRATPMQRAGSAGLWSVVVPLEPGRHVYAFVVDGKQWVVDSAAPRAPESEFGTPNSIVMVGGSS